MDPQQHRAAVEVVLRIADGLSLPVEAATETFLIVGKRGSGKSSTATRLAEQFIRSKVPIAVLDPVDVWWGLKAGATGTREGTAIGTLERMNCSASRVAVLDFPDPRF